MARVCDICGKSSKKGNQVARGIGNRVTRRTIRHQGPNLRTVRIEPDGGGNRVTMSLCTSCLKKMKRDKRVKSEKEASAQLLSA